jgi:starch-binding outer membrane protein, SusD/RagB family
MKKIIFISSVFLGLLTTSCQKQLDLQPYNALPTDQLFKTDLDFQTAVRGMYYLMVSPTPNTPLPGNNQGEYYAGGDNFSFVASNDILSDNAVSYTYSRNTGLTYSTWTYNGLTTTKFFQDGYAIIRAANTIIANIKNLPDANPNKNDYLGQAIAVRAIVHFDMVRLFGKAYTQASATDPGVPYITTVYDNASPAVPRDPVTSNYDNIRDDLLKAATLIEDIRNTDAAAAGRLSKVAIYGYLSRLYLCRGEWGNTITAAGNALALASDPGSLKDFPNIWTDATNNGVLFKLRILQTDQIMVGTSLGQSTKAEFMPTTDLFNLYQSNDVRGSAYFANVTDQNNGVNLELVTKYIGRGGTSSSNLVDIKLLRVAEVLLSRAEAYANAGGQDAAALADLDALRSQRYNGFVSGNETGQALKDAIALERRLELAFEGDRFVDLKRRNLPVQRSSATGGWSGGIARSWTASQLVMPAGDYRFQLPIDINSINASKGVIKQNPGNY